MRWRSGEKLRSGSAEVKAALSRQGRYTEITGNMRIKEVRISDTERFVICHNPEATERDKHMREQLVAQLTELVDGSDALSEFKRGELRGKIAAKPGLNRFCAPPRPASSASTPPTSRAAAWQVRSAPPEPTAVTRHRAMQESRHEASHVTAEARHVGDDCALAEQERGRVLEHLDAGTGRYHLVFQGERIGHAVKKTFTSRWEAHSGHGPKIPGSSTYSTRRDALIQVALHHRRMQEERPRRRR